MRAFEYIEPLDLSEVLDLLHAYGERAKVLAGGTDLIVRMKEQKLHPEVIISLRKLRPLDGVRAFSRDSQSLRVGSMTLLGTVASHPFFTGRLALLREAALAVGDTQIRNAATLGGNIANASPSADMPPALLSMGAEVKLQSKTGERRISLEHFFKSPFASVMRPDELLTEVLIDPLPEGAGAYLWMPKRTEVDETLVGVAAWLSCETDGITCREAFLSYNSASPVPMRAKEAESFLQGKSLDSVVLKNAGEIASQEVSPRSRAGYRRRVASVLTEQAIERALTRIQK